MRPRKNLYRYKTRGHHGWFYTLGESFGSVEANLLKVPAEDYRPITKIEFVASCYEHDLEN